MESTLSHSAAASPEQVALGKLAWAGPLAIAAAVVANLVVRVIAVALLNPAPEVIALGWGPPIIFTFAGVLGAVIVFALIGRFARRQPIALFRRVALVALIVSLIPNTLILFNPQAAPFPGATAGVVLALSLMHVLAWAISVGVLTRYARR
ncbi:MAG TPA: DUF6069 family protein [Kouleothrix sp.]|uniref:DUF6069 family protein n=1 Tax=Kouleothrix sp. TaxID=2779161 RepID=UPI002BAD7938|nr:DUF6069 family protein [Kouleothrix sp.]HRC77511.1 DUF6069 family protein [Kouleothrix sp.]